MTSRHIHLYKILFLLLIFLFLTKSYSRSAEEWKSRTIYQLLTDRFARTDGSTQPCSDLTKYCGGTFKGIQNNLDYITGMGFNAIWISPVQMNTKDGYHGYWYKDFYKINENYGSEQDLIDLIEECHQRDIFVMVDVVANHIGYLQEDFEKVEDNDYSLSVPFNDKSYFNPPIIECHNAEQVHPGDQEYLETCWLNWLPDLNQNHPMVRKMLLDWIKWFVETYKIDGLRLDALRHVPIDFWKEFQEAAGVYCIGEAVNVNIPYLAEYQKVISSMLNFPLTSKLFKSYVEHSSMISIANYYDEAFKKWPNIEVIANFIDNHDNPRFLSHTDDLTAFKAMTGFTIASVGIPVFYYGGEQAFKGGNDPMNREPLWTDMNTESEVYQFLRTLNNLRQKSKFYELDQIQREYDDNFYSFTRGDIFFAFTNLDESIKRVIRNHNYDEGTYLCNIFAEKECIRVIDGALELEMKNKEVKVLYPRNIKEKEEKQGILARIKNFIGNTLVIQHSSAGDI